MISALTTAPCCSCSCLLSLQLRISLELLQSFAQRWRLTGFFFCQFSFFTIKFSTIPPFYVKITCRPNNHNCFYIGMQVYTAWCPRALPQFSGYKGTLPRRFLRKLHTSTGCGPGNNRDCFDFLRHLKIVMAPFPSPKKGVDPTPHPWISEYVKEKRCRSTSYITLLSSKSNSLPPKKCCSTPGRNKRQTHGAPHARIGRSEIGHSKMRGTSKRKQRPRSQVCSGHHWMGEC